MSDAECLATDADAAKEDATTGGNMKVPACDEQPVEAANKSEIDDKVREKAGENTAVPSRADSSTSGEASSSANPNSEPRDPNRKRPTVLLVIGMAGTGKTSLMQRLSAHLHEKGTPPYIVNLDPAVTYMPYGPNIDIRDTVDYKNVMKQYKLGPNGGILTACNLFATRFDQVIQLCESKTDVEYILVDTPGQIEIFTWSASGAIVTEAFASSFPTSVVYVCDTPRCIRPNVFMSNMLQAVSILYKCKLPMLLAFNKVDVARHEYALEWMEDFEVFSAAVDHESSYSSSMSRSLCLVLDEFYQNLNTVGVSAVTGEGMEMFFEAAQRCKKEYLEAYEPELLRRRKQREQEEEDRKKVEMDKFAADAVPDAKAWRTKLDLKGDAGVDDDDDNDDDDNDDEDFKGEDSTEDDSDEEEDDGNGYFVGENA